MRFATLIISLLAVSLLTGFAVSQYPTTYVGLGIGAAAVFFIVFAKTELGLYILIFSMLLSPEIIIGQTGGASLGRGVTVRMEDFLLIVIGLSWFARNAVEKELGLFLRTPLNRAIIAYIFTCLVSTALGIMFGRVEATTGIFYVLKYIEYFIVFFMTVNHLQDIHQVKRFLFCLFLTCVIVSIIGIIQIPGAERVSAPFEGEAGEPNTFGGYLVFMLAVAAGILSQVERTRIREAMFLIILVILPPLLYTESRASYLALIPAVFVLGMLTEKRAIVVGVITAFFLASPFLVPGPVKERVLYTFNQPDQPGQVKVGGLKLDTSTSARLMSWRSAIHDWPKKPVFGYGVTGYAFVDAQFPRILMETGIVGLLAFIYLLYSIFQMAASHFREVQTPLARGICAGYLAGFIGLIFHSVGANTFIIVRIMEPFWFFTAIVCMLPKLENTVTTSN